MTKKTKHSRKGMACMWEPSFAYIWDKDSPKKRTKEVTVKAWAIMINRSFVSNVMGKHMAIFSKRYSALDDKNTWSRGDQMRVVPVTITYNPK